MKLPLISGENLVVYLFTRVRLMVSYYCYLLRLYHTISKYYEKLTESDFCFYDSNFTIFWKISSPPLEKSVLATDTTAVTTTMRWHWTVNLMNKKF